VVQHAELRQPRKAKALAIWPRMKGPSGTDRNGVSASRWPFVMIAGGRC
jgi:hypothetical protein